VTKDQAERLRELAELLQEAARTYQKHPADADTNYVIVAARARDFRRYAESLGLTPPDWSADLRPWLKEVFPEAEEDDLPPSWDRDAWEEEQTLTKRLLKHMLGRQKETMTDLAQEVWGSDSVTDNNIGVAVNRANQFLISQGHNRTLHRCKGVVRWQ
jgi:hypothetical protein